VQGLRTVGVPVAETADVQSVHVRHPLADMAA
jgi:hypothetical protein